MRTDRKFKLPDTIASSALTSFEFGGATKDEAAAILSGPPSAVFQRLLCDQESAASMLAARRILHAFLSRGDASADDLDAETIAARVCAARAEFASPIESLGQFEPAVRQAVVRQRAPLGLLGGCWLDTISQPATQPSVIVNRLLGHHFLVKGLGDPQRSAYSQRRRGLQDAGIYLPEIDASDFLRKADARPLTALHGSFYLALARLPANFLPEVVGVHYVVNALGVDDLLLGTSSLLPEPMLREALSEYLSLTRLSADGPGQRLRLGAAIGLALRLEREHVAMLAALAAWHDGLSLDAKIAAIVTRHAPFAGRQHRNVRIGGRLLRETLSDPNLDIAAFIRDLRESPQLRSRDGGDPRLLAAIKFGGPMFGIFDESEAATFRAWAKAVQARDLPEVEISPNRVGDNPAQRWADAIDRSEPADVVFRDAVPADDRQVFYRLVNIENFPNVLPLAKECTARVLADAEVLFVHGAGGKYTDASYFSYTPEALHQRVGEIYWDKLINPYRPLDEIPDREEVIFVQKMFALGNLIDGAWAHRIGNHGRFHRPSDGMLFSIYADEMGLGDLRKNHITLIHEVLDSMSIRLPHIRDEEFLDQDELPDSLYGTAIYQLSLGLFPDSLYNEILGFNLGIEMFGLGELRLHEMQKLQHHQFNISYEKAHLSIDNFSAGHARQSAELIISYLDGVQRNSGGASVQREWRRIWRGYAAFAYFVEPQLVKVLLKPSQPAGQPALNEISDLVI
jgi:Iron-containing redox enzyme